MDSFVKTVEEALEALKNAYCAQRQDVDIGHSFYYTNMRYMPRIVKVDGNERIEVITSIFAKKIASVLDALYVAKYQGVKNNKLWRDMYAVGNYNITFMSSTGAVICPVIEGVPCHNCGIIMPLQGGIHIDHYIPQSRINDKINNNNLR